MTRTGLYQHHLGELHRVLHVVRVATEGPSHGRLAVVYVSLRHGTLQVMDEEQFHAEGFDPAPELGLDPGVKTRRFSFVGEGVAISGADAEALYDGLQETFGGRRGAPQARPSDDWARAELRARTALKAGDPAELEAALAALWQEAASGRARSRG